MEKNCVSTQVQMNIALFPLHYFQIFSVSRNVRVKVSIRAMAKGNATTVAAMHPLDVVRTRFQVNDGRVSNLPTYKNTTYAILSIARLEGMRGLCAGFSPAVPTLSWGLYFFFYGRAKQRYSENEEEKLSPSASSFCY